MGDADDIILITADAIDADGLLRAIRRDTSGALASFVGVVRNHDRGRRVHHLVYEAYAQMAELEMRRIAQQARARWELDGMALVHRTGRLEVGEASVLVAVAAPHRREALEACAYGIERIKADVPIWKKEFGEDGEEWIVGDPSSR